MFATKRFGNRERYSTNNAPKDGIESTTDSRLSAFPLPARLRYIVGCILVSLGIFVSATGGSWDITNHLLNKPESFFSPPHGMLYAGVASAILGCVVLSRECKYTHGFYQSFHNATTLVIIGITMLVVAGPVDFAWHSAFGLDGLLSPPHFVLLMGMVISSLGSLIGLIVSTGTEDIKHRSYVAHVNSLHDRRFFSACLIFMRPHVAMYLTIMGIIPMWLSLAGVISMFSLPFSKTQYFDFNPEPSVGAVVATVGYPVLLSLMLISSFRLGKNKFGVISLTALVYVLIGAVTVIIPNESLIPTLPFYLFNLVPIVAVDALLTTAKSRFAYPIYIIGGAILGSVFFMMQYPLITHVYNEVVTRQAFVWPSMTSSIYFGMIGQIYPLVAVPGATMGIIGAMLANSIVHKKFLSIAKSKESDRV